MPPNFVLLDATLPDVTRLVAHEGQKLAAGSAPQSASAMPRGRITGTGGRQKLISDRLRVHLKRPWKGKADDEEKTNADRIAEVLIEAATNGSLPHALAVMDRTEGKPAQMLEHAVEHQMIERIVYEVKHPKQIEGECGPVTNGKGEDGGLH